MSEFPARITPKVVIIGGGIHGVSIVYYLQLDLELHPQLWSKVALPNFL